MIDRARIKPVLSKLRDNPSALRDFVSNPRPTLEAAGIPTEEISPAGAANWSCDVELKWWGVEFIMNEALTQAIAIGAVPVGVLGSFVAASMAAAGLLTGPIAAVAGTGFAMCVTIKVAQIKLVDQGNGVYWPITWLQWATVIAAVPLGPVGVAAAFTLVVHPLAN